MASTNTNISKDLARREQESPDAPHLQARASNNEAMRPPHRPRFMPGDNEEPRPPTRPRFMPGDEEARIALTPRRPRFMPGDDERQRAPLDSHDRFPGLSSLQWTTANNPRLARRDIQYQLGKTTEALSKAKAELQAREKLAKMSVQQSPGDAELEVESKKEVEREKLAEAHRSKKPVKQSTEEDEVEVKAREDKEKEKVAEARRAKKNARRENWAKKLAQDFERREAKRQEKALRLKDGEGVEGIAGKGTAEAAEKNGVRN